MVDLSSLIWRNTPAAPLSDRTRRPPLFFGGACAVAGTAYPFLNFLPQTKEYCNLFSFEKTASSDAKQKLLHIIKLKYPYYIFIPTHYIERWIDVFSQDKVHDASCVLMTGRMETFIFLRISRKFFFEIQWAEKPFSLKWQMFPRSHRLASYPELL